MKKYIVMGIVVLLLIGGFLFISRNKNSSQTSNTTLDKISTPSKNPFQNVTDMCVTLSKEQVSSLLGKQVLKINPVTTNTIHSCQYYISDTQAVTVTLNAYNIENQKKGHVALGRKITTSAQIPMEHFLVIQENGLINEIYLVLSSNEYVSINRTSSKTLTEDEMVAFAAKLAGVIAGKTALESSSNITPTITKTVPLPQETDILRTFFNLIEEKKPADAVSMMNISSDSDKQAWAVQFNAINSIKVLSIEPALQNDWTDTRHEYEVTLDVKMNPNSANAPIPYYGWDNGQNTRWINVQKTSGLWRITGIATGP